MSTSGPLKAMESIQENLEREGVAGFDFMAVVSLLLGLFQNCKKPSPTPEPQPATSVATPEGWKTACEARSFADQHFDADNATYTRSVLSHGAGELMRKARHGDSGRLKRQDAIRTVATNLDEARQGDLEANALLVDAAK